MSKIIFKRLSANAKTPVKATDGSIGFDIFCAYEVEIPACGSVLVLTDLSFEMPQGICLRVAPISKLMLLHGITVGESTIINKLGGGLGVVLFNHGDSDLTLKKGDACAQLIFENYLYDAILVDGHEFNRESGILESDISGVADVINELEKVTPTSSLDN